MLHVELVRANKLSSRTQAPIRSFNWRIIAIICDGTLNTWQRSGRSTTSYTFWRLMKHRNSGTRTFCPSAVGSMSQVKRRIRNLNYSSGSKPLASQYTIESRNNYLEGYSYPRVPRAKYYGNYRTPSSPFFVQDVGHSVTSPLRCLSFTPYLGDDLAELPEDIRVMMQSKFSCFTGSSSGHTSSVLVIDLNVVATSSVIGLVPRAWKMGSGGNSATITGPSLSGFAFIGMLKPRSQSKN